MTDYNDGEWHLWDGNHRPDGVHPESLLSYVWHDERTGKCGITEDSCAGRAIAWSQVLKFRVTRVHHEPRVILVNEYQPGNVCAYNTEDMAREYAGPNATRIAVRYVEARNEPARVS